MEEKIRLGVIGIGFAWDRLHWPALKQLSDKYEISAICNKSVDKAEGFASSISLPSSRIYSDYRKMLERDDLDAVDVLTPISENFEVTKDVLNSGRHVIAEKPFASSPEAARELISIKNRQNLTVLVAENFRYAEENTMMKKILTEGELGEAIYFIQNTGAGFEKEQTTGAFAAKEWRQHPDFEGGIFLDGAVHDMARLRFLFGEAGTLFASARPQEEEYCPYMAINALINFTNGVSGQYTYRSDVSEWANPPVGFRVYCTGGEIYLESKECGKIRIFRKDGGCEERPFTPERGYFGELLNFWGALKKGDQLLSTPEKELGDIELIFAILQSIREKTVIPVFH